MAGIKIKAKLSQRGRSKLNKIPRIIEKEARRSLQKNFNVITKPAIVAGAPIPTAEAAILSSGNSPNFGLVGTPSGGRFFKGNGQKTVKEALMEERPKIDSNKVFVNLKFGDPRIINPKIGFSWLTQRGQTRSTNISQLLWANLIQVWENGMNLGVAARITSRGPYRLHPQPGVRVPYVDKVIQPFKMFSNGYKNTRSRLAKSVATDIKSVARKIK